MRPAIRRILGIDCLRKTRVLWCVCACVTVGVAAAPANSEHFARCAACHLSDGSGVPGLFPPLAGHVGRFLDSAAGRGYLARLVVGGTSGTLKVEVEGIRYSGVMPSVVADLSDAKVAGLLNDLAMRFAPAALLGALFAADDVAKARAAGPLTGAERPLLRRRALLRSRLAGNGMDAPRARRDWMLHCQGCHGAAGALETAGMPALQGRIAGALQTIGGRARLVRVPGVANAGLSDARVADTLNWMLVTFEAEHLPDDFEAFTGEEVGALRGGRPLEGAAPSVASLPRRE